MIESINRFVSRQPFLYWGAGIFAILAFCTSFARVGIGDLRGSDDYIWLYLTGVQVTHSDRANSLDQELLQVTAERSATEESQLRYKLRANYRGNYYSYSYLVGLLAKHDHNGAQSDLGQYAKATGKTFVQSIVIQGIIAFSLLFLGILSTRRVQLMVALALALLILSISTLIQPSTIPGNFLFFDPMNKGRMLQNILLFIVNPGSQFSVFGFTPRSAFLVFSLLVFAWRWHGWTTASYVVAAAVIFLHQSMTMILIFNLVVLDIVFRPRILLKPGVFLTIVAAAVIFSVRESLWSVVLPQVNSSHVLLWAIVIFGLILGASAAFSALRRLRRRYPMYFDEAAHRHKIESVALLLFWLLTLPIGYLISLKVDYLHGHYFWYQLHARVWSLYLPVAMLGLSLWFVERHWGPFQRRAYIAVISACVFSGISIAACIETGFNFKPFYSQLKSMAAGVGKPIWMPIGPDDEPVIYMAMARSIDTGEDYLKPMIDPAPGFDVLSVKQEPYLEKCNGTPKALIIWLHTWSADLSQVAGEAELQAIPDACVISPNFNGVGGSNTNTCGSHDSLERIHDVILDAENRHGRLPVVLVGASGGGMHALLTLGTFPGLVQAASIWVPIYDLEKWYWERPDHRPELEKCFGAPPSQNDANYLARSPKSVLSAVQGAKIVVNLGKADEETPPWHARAAVAQMQAGCPACKIDLMEWDMGHSYKKDVLQGQIRDLMDEN